MTIERLSENPVLPFDRNAIISGGLPLAKYLHELVVDQLQKEYLYKIIYYINHLPQTMTWSGGDSCDATHPVVVNFKIPAEMTEITSVKLSFELHPFRAYSTGAASGGGATSSSGGGMTATSSDGGAQTSSSGGGQTTSSGGAQTSSSGGGQTTSDGGAQTSSAGGAQTSSQSTGYYEDTTQVRAGGNDTSSDDGSGGLHSHSWTEDYPGHKHTVYMGAHTHDVADHTHTVSDHNHTVADHTHTVSDHTHTVSDHTHTVANHTHQVVINAHTHTVPDHTHGMVFGIYEETNSPTVYFEVDNVGDGTYGLPSDNYTESQTDIDITDQVTGTGRKHIRFSADDLCRIVAEIEVKVKVRAE